MLDALSAGEREYYSDEDNVWQPDGIADVLIASIESQFGFVAGPHAEYLKYFKRPDLPPRMWRWRPTAEARAIAGFACVPKKDGVWLRKLLMSCSTNAQWSDPRVRRRLGLFGGGVLCGVLVPHDAFDLAVCDASNAFTRIATPEWWWPWFATPPVAAGEVWDLLDDDLRARVEWHTPVSAQYMRLGMGCSHSVNILMDIGLRASGEAFRASAALTEKTLGAVERPSANAWLAQVQTAAAARTRCLVILVFHFGPCLADAAGVLHRRLADTFRSAKLLLADALDLEWDPAGTLGGRDVEQYVGEGEVDLLVWFGTEPGEVTAARSSDFWSGPDDPGGVADERHAWDGRWRAFAGLIAAQHRSGGSYALCQPVTSSPPVWRLAQDLGAILDDHGARELHGGSRDPYALATTMDGVPPPARCFRRPPDAARVIGDLAVPTLARYLREGSGATGSRMGPQAPARVTQWGRHANRCSGPSPGKSVPPPVAFLNEDAERKVQTVLDARQRAFYLHVDDGLSMTSDVAPEHGAQHMMNQVADGWESIGFHVPDRRVSERIFRVIGYEIESRPAEVRLPRTKAAELHSELTDILRPRVVEVARLSHAMGVWVWGAILRRQLLSVPFVLFQQLSAATSDTLMLRPAARTELRIMRDLLPLMVLDLGSPPPSVIFATDARGARDDDHGGYGVVATAVTRPEALACFEQARQLSYTVPVVSGDTSALRFVNDDILRTVPHSILPSAILAQSRWGEVEHGGWNRDDHINLGESRTVIRLARRLAASPSFHRQLVITLQDNSATAGSLTKGRSPSYALNHCCRIFAAACLAARLRFVIPWVETYKQTADVVSRL